MSSVSTCNALTAWRQSRLRQMGPICLALAVAFVYALATIWNALFAPGWETPLLLMVLGTLVAFHACQAARKLPHVPRLTRDTASAWTILLLFFLLALLPLPLGSDWIQCLCFCLFLLAPLRFLAGHAKTLLGLLPLAIFCVAIPMHVEILLALSHPLRLLATMLTGMTLKPFFPDLSYHLTVLRLTGGTELSITDACSGIEQLEALLLLGYLLVRHQQTTSLWRIVQYLFCLPAVILANTVRLILVVVLCHTPIGAAVLQGRWHQALGFLQVLLAVFLVWGTGELIRIAVAPETHKKEENA